MMEGEDGGRGAWSYRLEHTGSSSYTPSACSSRSGTIVSTSAYSSSRTRMSFISMESAAMRFDFEADDLYGDEASCDETEKMMHIESLVQEFFGAPSTNRGDIVTVLQRWFLELDVGWVFHITSAAAGSLLWQEQRDFAGSWIRALTAIMGSISHASSYISESHSSRHSSMAKKLRREGQYIPDPVQFALFAQETLLKMLPFVDAIVAPSLETKSQLFYGNGSLQNPLLKPIKILLDVRGAVLMASRGIQSSFCSKYSADTTGSGSRIQGEMVSLLSEKETKLGEAIWNTMEEVRARTLAWADDDDDYSRAAHIHKANRSLTNYIKFLRGDNYASFNQIADGAANLGKYAPKISFVPPLSSFMWEMVYCLEEKLSKKSESLFPDQSLRFLFLINNSHFIWQQLQTTPDLEYHMPDLERRMKRYVESYLEISWAPVMSCLYKICTPLAKFESRFNKTYDNQKLWKVQDPELRGRPRTAIVKKVTPDYRKHLEQKSVATPKFTAEELEDLLQELFEG